MRQAEKQANNRQKTPFLPEHDPYLRGVSSGESSAGSGVLLGVRPKLRYTAGTTLYASYNLHESPCPVSQDDFDLASLAAYLHLIPQQVERLAQRGKVPGRKVGGQWRFSSAEIHHWMEERIGLLDDSELSHMEGALDRAATSHDAPPLTICEMLTPSRIAVPLIARTRGSVIKAMVELATQSGVLWDPDRMEDAIRRREELQSTAMDNGVALLHPRRPLPDIMSDGFLALGICPQGIPFGGSHVLTEIFFLLGSVDDRSHLRTLARLSRLISDGAFLGTLRKAADVSEVYAALQAKEEELQ